MKQSKGFSAYSDVFASDVMSQNQGIEGPEDLARLVAENKKKVKAQKLENSKKAKPEVKKDQANNSKTESTRNDDKPRGARRGNDSRGRGGYNQSKQNFDNNTSVVVNDSKDDRYKRPMRGNRERETGDRKSRMVKSSFKATSEKHGRSDNDWNDEMKAENELFDNTRSDFSSRGRGYGRGRYNNNSRGYNRVGQNDRSEFTDGKKSFTQEKFEDYENIDDEPAERFILEEGQEGDDVDSLEEEFNNTRGQGRRDGEFRTRRAYTPRGEGNYRGRREYAPRAEGDNRGRREYTPRAEGDNRGRREYTPRGDGEYRGRREYTPRGVGDTRGRREYTPRAEGDNRGRRDYTPRGEGDQEGEYRGRRDYTPRGEGEKEGEYRGRREYTPRVEGDNRGRRDYTPRGDGDQEGEYRGRKEYTPRSEGRQEGEYRGRREYAPRVEGRQEGDFAPRGEYRGKQSRGQGDSYEKSENGPAQKQQKQFVFHEGDFPTIDQAYQ